MFSLPCLLSFLVTTFDDIPRIHFRPTRVDSINGPSNRSIKRACPHKGFQNPFAMFIVCEHDL